MTENVARLSQDKYLTVCGQIEKTVAAIYDHWSREPEFDAELQALWKLMNVEEIDHFNQIEMLKRLTRGAEIGARTLSDERVVTLASYAKNCLERIKATPVTAEEALSLAIQLEDTFMEFHAKQAFVCNDKGLEKMFSNLSRNDKEHTERLKEVYKKRFSVDPPVKHCPS